LAALPGSARVEVAFSGIKGMWGGPRHLWLRSLATLGLLDRPARLRLLDIRTVFRTLPGSEHGPLLDSGRSVVAGRIVAAAVLIDPWIVAVNVAIDNLVARAWAIVAAGRRVGPTIVSIVSHSIAGVPNVVVHTIGPVVVHPNIVVIDVSMDRIVAIEVVLVYGTIDDVPVHVDVVVAVVDVDVVYDIYPVTAAIYPPAIPTIPAPASVPPSGVIDTTPPPAVAPAEVKIQPGADGKANAEGEGRAPIRPAIINDGRIIDRNVDVLWLIRSDRDVVVVFQNFLLRRRLQIPCTEGHMTETLNRRCDVGGLVDVGLPNGCSPVDLVGHHFDNRWVVCDGSYSDIPVLVINAVLAIGANVARGLFHLVRKSRGDKELSKKRVRIECDRR